MIDHYEVPEVIAIGRAQDEILGSPKDLVIFDDSPSQDWRNDPCQDDE